MPFLYDAYGLVIAVDHPIPGLIAAVPPSPVDIHISLDAALFERRPSSREAEIIRYESPWRDARGRPTLVVSEFENASLFSIRFIDGTEFFMDGSAEHVWL